MQALEVTNTAQEHKMPAGTKVLILTDNTRHLTYVNFEVDATLEAGDEGNLPVYAGKNTYQVPEGRDSFSIISEMVYTVGVDYLKFPGEGPDPATQAQLDDHEARIAALEGTPSTASTQSKPNFAARKK